MSKQTAEVSDPRFLRLLKSSKTSKSKKAAANAGEVDMFQNEEPNTAPVETPEAESLLILAEGSEEILKWIKSKTADSTFGPALSLFNLFNKGTNPDAPLAKQLTLTVLKGTSFADKRDTCMNLIRSIRQGEHDGEIELVHSPYLDDNDPTRNDPWAMKAVPKGYPEEKFLGYIPKAQGINKSFTQAMQAGMGCGAHIIAAKHTDFKNNDNQIITIVTGWKSPKTEEPS